MLIGVLYIIFGNYFKTIKANYFIGIRTPWTLENDNVWKKTHKLGGILWFIGGIIVVLSSLISDKPTNFRIFLGVTILITVIPIIYSYVVFNKEKQIEQGA
ncbi:SdpI family protein [Joostella sp.]|uniref:SdpI family protein n=1 Tax=Joostella sp. TaxID=2231138 RepID=UPI003A91CC3A